MIDPHRKPLVRTLKLATAAVALGALVNGAGAQSPGTATAPKFVAFGKTAPVTPVALWTDQGKPMALRGAEAKNAPPSATVIEVVSYDLDGPSYRRVIFPKGARFSPPSNPAGDTILYVLKGRVEVKLGDEAPVTVGPNDAFRERAGTITRFHALERSELVETGVPPAAPK